MNKLRAVLSLLLALTAATAQQATSWREVYQQSRDAHERRDFAKYRETISALVELLHGHSETLYGMAKAEALAGNRSSALRWLEVYAKAGLYKDAAEETDLANLRTEAGFEAIKKKLGENTAPVSKSKVWMNLPNDFVPEDIAFDPVSRRWFVTSIRHRKVIWIDERGATGDWLTEGQDGIWAVLAIGIDAKRRILWVTTEAMPRSSRRLHLSTPSLSKQIKELEQALGYALFERKTREVTLTRAGDAFITEARQSIAGAERAVECGYAASRGDTGILRCGYSPWSAPSLLMEVQIALAERVPHTRLLLRSAYSGQQVDLLLQGKIQAGSSNSPSSHQDSKCMRYGMRSCWLPCRGTILCVNRWRSICGRSSMNLSFRSPNQHIRCSITICSNSFASQGIRRESSMRSIAFANCWILLRPAMVSLGFCAISALECEFPQGKWFGHHSHNRNRSSQREQIVGGSALVTLLPDQTHALAPYVAQ